MPNLKKGSKAVKSIINKGIIKEKRQKRECFGNGTSVVNPGNFESFSF